MLPYQKTNLKVEEGHNLGWWTFLGHFWYYCANRNMFTKFEDYLMGFTYCQGAKIWNQKENVRFNIKNAQVERRNVNINVGDPIFF